MTGLYNIPGYGTGHEIDGKPISGHGYATFVLTVLLKNQVDTLALRLRQVQSAYTLYINDKVVMSNGQIGRSRDQMIPEFFPKISEFTPKGHQIEIILQASNFHHRNGGPWETIQIRVVNDIRELRLKTLAQELFLIGSIFIIALYHFGLFLIRREDKSSLYFGISCLLISMRFLSISERFLLYLFPQMSWEVLSKWEYLSTYLAAPAFFMFVRALFPKVLNKMVFHIFLLVTIILDGIVLFTPVDWFSYTMPVFELIIGLVGIYIIYGLLLATFQKKDGASIFLAGLFIFIFSQAFILSLRFSHAFSKIETLSKELEINNKALAKTNQLKDEFLSNMSHELRTPMHGILSFSKFGIDKIDKTSKEKNLFYFNNISKSAKRLMALLDDLLSLSSLEANKENFQLKIVDIFSLANIASANIEAIYKEKNIKIEIEKPSISSEIVCDKYKINQVIRNLLSNAVKFNPENNLISITFNSHELIPDTQSATNTTVSMIIVSVKDGGIGIPQNELELVFDKFVQSSKTKTGAGGTGLGLSICQEIVKAHKGKIWAENNPEGGVKFSFMLPYTQENTPT